MKVEFLKRFSKDLDDVTAKSAKQSIIRVIELLEAYDNLDAVSGLKKLKGHKSAYRIRIGDYRLGFFFENSTVLLARVLHRKDIYKIFP